MAEIEIKNLMFEGKKIPNFNFMDLDGKKYNYNNTTGKIIVLKLWFINCQTCIQEMPQLNGLVKKYSDRNDVLFLSLAFDNSKKLKKFLSKTTFKYAVVANKEKYILETLQVNEFPTHIVLNKKGIIVKVLTSARLLPEILSKILI
jgi:peroxiredoxin